MELRFEPKVLLVVGNKHSLAVVVRKGSGATGKMMALGAVLNEIGLGCFTLRSQSISEIGEKRVGLRFEVIFFNLSFLI